MKHVARVRIGIAVPGTHGSVLRACCVPEGTEVQDTLRIYNKKTSCDYTRYAG